MQRGGWEGGGGGVGGVRAGFFKHRRGILEFTKRLQLCYDTVSVTANCITTSTSPCSHCSPWQQVRGTSIIDEPLEFHGNVLPPEGESRRLDR